jgi:hypothetical protein
MNKRLDNYFEQVKKNPPLMDIEKVNQIITEAEIKTEVEVEVKKGHRNFLKIIIIIIIMTTLFAVILSVFLLWPKAPEEIPNSNYPIPKGILQTADSIPIKEEMNINPDEDLIVVANNNKISVSAADDLETKVEVSGPDVIESNTLKTSNYAIYNNLKNDSCDFQLILFDKKAFIFNDKQNTIWLSINSDQTKALVSGEYRYTVPNKKERVPMSFSGQYFINPDSTLKITNGIISIDTSKANHSVVYEFILENKQKISGMYLPKPVEEEILISTIEKPKIEFVYTEQLMDSTHFIELNREELEQFGFTLNDSSIFFRFLFNVGIQAFTKLKDNSMIFGVQTDGKKERNEDNTVSNFKAENFNFSRNKQDLEKYHKGKVLMLATDEKGKTFLKMGMPKIRLEEMISSKYSKNRLTLLPIVIKKNIFGDQPKQNVVYWFLPTDQFLSDLPKHITVDLLNEIDYLDAKEKLGTEKPECKYFDECKNTLDVSNFKVFPNPANSNATVTFNLNEAINGKISLVDLTGRERQVLQPQTQFSVGSHHFDLDVSDVPEGIYLITLYSDKGIQTQRFIVTR